MIGGKAVVAPFFKDGDKRYPLNCRGISLLSIVGKIYGGIINRRVMEWCEKYGVIAEEQGGFRVGRGCTDQIFTLLELIKGRKCRLYCCFIDVKKAYDRVFRDGLWKRLWDVSIRGKMWRVLVGIYNKVESCVRVNSEKTEWFGVEVGVRQGCVLSPVLFSVFINGLVDVVKELGLGVEFGVDMISMLLYADDIVLFAKNRLEMLFISATVYEYSKRWRFEVNVKKTKIVVFGGQDQEDFELGSQKVGVVDKYKYLGMLVRNRDRGRWKIQKEKMIRKASKRLGKAWSMAMISGCLSVRSGIKIWQALVRPVLEYGAEVWEEESDCLWIEAERVQLKMGKRILGCSMKMSNEVVRGELGWWTMRGRRVYLRICYWGKLVKMSSDRLARRVYSESRRRWVEEGKKNWCSYTYRLMRMVGLEDEWEREECGKDWKKIVYSKVQWWEESSWRVSMLSKRKLRVYRVFQEKLCFERYLESEKAEGRRELTRFGGGTNRLRIEIGRREGLEVEDRVCQFCCSGVED